MAEGLGVVYVAQGDTPPTVTVHSVFYKKKRVNTSSPVTRHTNILQNLEIHCIGDLSVHTRNVPDPTI